MDTTVFSHVEICEFEIPWSLSSLWAPEQSSTAQSTCISTGLSIKTSNLNQILCLGFGWLSALVRKAFTPATQMVRCFLMSFSTHCDVFKTDHS